MTGKPVIRPMDVMPDELDAPFWEGCNRREFLIHRCIECGRAYWPASTCLDHGSSSMEWQAASGRGEVFTYTVVHHPYLPSLADKLPYAVAVVRLDEGPFFHSDIVGCPASDVHVGMRVRVMYDPVDDEHVIPRFEPAEPAESAEKEE